MFMQIKLLAGITTIVFHINTCESFPGDSPDNPEPYDMHDLQHTEQNS